MDALYDTRTALLLPPLNALLTRHYLPTIAHPSEITPSLLIALYESLIHTRLPAIDRKDKSPTAQIRNIKFLLGTMVMAGWDVGVIDPVGVVEREESCLMDLVQVLVEVGREQYGVSVSSTSLSTSLDVGAQRELSTIVEATTIDSDDSATSVSTLRPIHDRADAILSRIQDLNPNLRPSSPTSTVISRATQTSPPPPQFTTPRPRRKPKLLKRTPARPPPRRKHHERGIQTDDDDPGTESGIPSSIPLSFSSSSSWESPPNLRIPSRPPRPLHASRTLPPRLYTPSPLRTPTLTHRPRPRSKTPSSSSESHFRIDSPYTAALRRRRHLAIDSLRHHNRHRSSVSHRNNHRIRVLSVGRDVADSTFAEDSDVSTPRARGAPRGRGRRRQGEVSSGRGRRRGGGGVSDVETTTDALTDLERRVRALRIWGGIEEERKEVLVRELRRKAKGEERSWVSGKGGEEEGGGGSDGLLRSRSVSQSSMGSGSRGSIMDIVSDSLRGV